MRTVANEEKSGANLTKYPGFSKGSRQRGHNGDGWLIFLPKVTKDFWTYDSATGIWCHVFLPA